MSNQTDPFARQIHGMNPQNLIEKIMRNRIYESLYWKEQCFGLTSATLVDKAVDINHIGGTYGGNQKPTPFICLILKMLQLQPETEIVLEFIQNEDYKYVRALGIFYLRLVGSAVEIYKYLEPIYNDYRKLRVRKVIGWEIMHMDEFVDQLLCEEFVCNVSLPRLQNRINLEQSNVLKPRKSPLEDELELEIEDAREKNEQEEDKSGSKSTSEEKTEVNS